MYSGEIDEEQSSEASEKSFVSASEEFCWYNESVSPIQDEYREKVAQEEEEEILWSRLSWKLKIEK